MHLPIITSEQVNMYVCTGRVAAYVCSCYKRDNFVWPTNPVYQKWAYVRNEIISGVSLHKMENSQKSRPVYVNNFNTPQHATTDYNTECKVQPWSCQSEITVSAVMHACMQTHENLPASNMDRLHYIRVIRDIDNKPPGTGGEFEYTKILGFKDHVWLLMHTVHIRLQWHFLQPLSNLHIVSKFLILVMIRTVTHLINKCNLLHVHATNSNAS